MILFLIRARSSVLSIIWDGVEGFGWAVFFSFLFQSALSRSLGQLFYSCEALEDATTAFTGFRYPYTLEAMRYDRVRLGHPMDRDGAGVFGQWVSLILVAAKVGIVSFTAHHKLSNLIQRSWDKKSSGGRFGPGASEQPPLSPHPFFHRRMIHDGWIYA